MAKPLKNAFIVAGVVADVALMVLSLVLMVAGYFLWGWVALLAAFGLVAAAARFWANSPAPVTTTDGDKWFVWDEELEDGLSDVERQMLRYGYVRIDPVEAHADLARTRGEPGWPETPLLQPDRPACGRHRRQP